MGISSSLVLGVPVGIVITNIFGWRSVFLGIAILAVLSGILIYKFLEKIPTEKILPLSAQIRALGNLKTGSAHLAMMFMLAGDRKSTRLNSSHVAISYAVF